MGLLKEFQADYSLGVVCCISGIYTSTFGKIISSRSVYIGGVGIKVLAAKASSKEFTKSCL